MNGDWRFTLAIPLIMLSLLHWILFKCWRRPTAKLIRILSLLSFIPRWIDMRLIPSPQFHTNDSLLPIHITMSSSNHHHRNILHVINGEWASHRWWTNEGIHNTHTVCDNKCTVQSYYYYYLTYLNSNLSCLDLLIGHISPTSILKCESGLVKVNVWLEVGDLGSSS